MGITSRDSAYSEGRLGGVSDPPQRHDRCGVASVGATAQLLCDTVPRGGTEPTTGVEAANGRSSAPARTESSVCSSSPSVRGESRLCVHVWL